MATGGAKKKGKNLSEAGEEQVTRSWLNVAQDADVGTGQKSDAFWIRVQSHYAENVVGDSTDRPHRSLATKWSQISHDVSKFVSAYATVTDMNPSGANEDDIITRALQLYQQGHAKGCEFTFLSCWRILRDVPKWNSLRDSIGDRPSGRKFTKRVKFEAVKSKHQSEDVKEVIAESQRHRACVLELQTHITLFSANLESMDADSRRFFTMTRKRVLSEMDELVADVDDL